MEIKEILEGITDEKLPLCLLYTNGNRKVEQTLLREYWKRFGEPYAVEMAKLINYQGEYESESWLEDKFIDSKKDILNEFLKLPKLEGQQIYAIHYNPRWNGWMRKFTHGFNVRLVIDKCIKNTIFGEIYIVFKNPDSNRKYSIECLPMHISNFKDDFFNYSNYEIMHTDDYEQFTSEVLSMRALKSDIDNYAIHLRQACKDISYIMRGISTFGEIAYPKNAYLNILDTCENKKDFIPIAEHPNLKSLNIMNIEALRYKIKRVYFEIFKKALNLKESISLEEIRKRLKWAYYFGNVPKTDGEIENNLLWKFHFENEDNLPLINSKIDYAETNIYKLQEIKK